MTRVQQDSQPLETRPDGVGSIACTRSVRVEVAPSFLADQSNPSARQYVFGYRIRIANESPVPVKLMSRHWIIVDSLGREHEVSGEGVIGKRPRIEPGQAFEYSSHCPLRTPWGTMEGSFTMRCEDGEEFQARVARFYLVSEPHAGESPR
jgi:ApaG protein